MEGSSFVTANVSQVGRNSPQRTQSQWSGDRGIDYESFTRVALQGEPIGSERVKELQKEHKKRKKNFYKNSLTC